MRLRKVKNAIEKLTESKYFLIEPTQYKEKWAEVFKNNHDIHIEIGTGKGNFLLAMAEEYPDINFIGIEKYESVLVRAIEKTKDLELPNIRFILFDAKEIENLFHTEIKTVYLNFSDPWPKKRHENRRLTSPEFLKKYDNIFKGDRRIVQKTDNIGLFAYSLEQLSQHGYLFEKVSLDLQNEEIKNFPTEYEMKFMELGFKINYVDARKKNKKE